jgi:hypothetical protein
MASAQAIMTSFMLLASGPGLGRRVDLDRGGDLLTIAILILGLDGGADPQVRLLRHALGDEEDRSVVERDALVADVANPALEILTAGLRVWAITSPGPAQSRPAVTAPAMKATGQWLVASPRPRWSMVVSSPVGLDP